MPRRAVRFFVLTLALWIAATWGLASCASPTDITLLVTTDFDCKDLHHVTITVGALGSTLETAPPTTLSTSCRDGFAGRLVVVPSGSKEDVVAIKVVGGFGKSKQAEDCAASYDPASPQDHPRYGPGCIVARRALHYTPHTPLTVPIVLRAACDGVACAETETCVNGSCAAATILDTATCKVGDGCGESVLGDGGLPGGGADAGTSDAAADAVADAVTSDALADATVTSSLLALTISAGALSPAFSPTTLSYGVVPSVVSLGTPFTLTPTYATGDSVTINGTPVASGAASPVIALGLLTPTPVDVTFTPTAGAPTHYAIVVPPVQEAYVKASNARAGAQLGYSVALAGDTLAVGAPLESSNAKGIDGNQGDTSAPSAGAVYVYTRSGATWSRQAYIKASNALAGDYFGVSVALEGDTLAVGSREESSGANGINGNQGNTSAAQAGAVYVFTRSGTTWSQQAYVKASNTGPAAFFGVSVALAGDTLAVGSYGESSNATGINGNQANTQANTSGAVYVFTRTGTTWSQQAYVKASNSRAAAAFGGSVALAGDTLAVGASGESSNATGINGNQANTSVSNAGAVYVFTRSGTTWAQQAYVKASNPRMTAYFGRSVALSADTLAVASFNESSNASGINGNQSDISAVSAGAVYVFTRTGTTWSQQAYVKASNTRAGAYFGFSVALAGDTLAVGSHFESSNATGINGIQSDTSADEGGAVYGFTRSGTTWSQQAYVKASNTRAYGTFGFSMALSGDTLAVGAVGESSKATGINGTQADTSATYAGAVYILR